MAEAPSLERFPIHLGLWATAVSQPEFTGAMAWYMDYSARHASDGAEGRLVGMHRFSESWTSWEMHPVGDEVVLCVSGEMTIIQELADGRIVRTRLGAGDYTINAPGMWHTADVAQEATAVFITAGMGTEHRPR
ncbi:MAG: cupin [Novosphingobium sp.]